MQTEWKWTMEDSEAQKIIAEAKEVLQLESQSILQLGQYIDESFTQLVQQICDCKGRVIIGGIGKSGIIGRKITATLNSTGTRSIFLHPVEALHGDLGMVEPEDLFLGLSYTGETNELNALVGSLRKMGCRIIAFTGNPRSTLAKQSDIVINVSVEKEACPLGLAPTCSTTAMLAMGDALAVTLINRKRFNSEDFKRFHPGGALGQRLAGKVRDIMLTGDSVPLIGIDEEMSTAMERMNQHSLGVILIVDRNRTLAGIITDGDIRRIVAQRRSPLEIPIEGIMTGTPHVAYPETPAYDALNTMERYQITILPIIDENREIKGILHLHDILGKGEFKFNGG
jgi:arabinose-5-phosphate isomerase